VQVDVCVVVIDVGAHTSVTPDTAGVPPVALVTAMAADPETFAYPAAAECATQLPAPALVGVKAPPLVIVPPVAVHVTAEL
jgi:hypothetical protein